MEIAAHTIANNENVETSVKNVNAFLDNDSALNSINTRVVC